jgi:hypothetical protein
MTVNTNAANTSAILALQNSAGSSKIFRVSANPESSITGSIGDIADDATNGVVYVKTSGTSTTTGWSPLANLGTKTFLVVEGGQYSTVQAAIAAAPAGSPTVPAYSVILVGPKANAGTSQGTWGAVTLDESKALMIVGLGGGQTNKHIKIDSLTYNSTTSGLNANLTENYVAGLYITSSSASSIVTLSGTGAIRLRLNNCHIVNSGAGDVITNSNTNTSSSLYLDGCIVSAQSATGIAVKHTGVYTYIKNRCDISTTAAGTNSSTGRSLSASAGVVEVYDSIIGGASNPRPAVELTGTAFLSAAYTTISNPSNDANARCVFVNSATALLAAGHASLSLGSSFAAAGQVVSGTGTFAPGDVSFTYGTSISGVTQSPISRTGGTYTTAGWFTSDLHQGVSGVAKLLTMSSGRITRYNNAGVSDGQLLIGSTAEGFKAAALTQGSGIVVTNAAGGITVAADPTLATIAALTTGADKLAYFTGVDVAAVTDFTAAGREIVATAASGSSGQVLMSSGSGAPSWKAQGTVSGFTEATSAPAVGDLCFISSAKLTTLGNEQFKVIGVKSASGTVVSAGVVVAKSHASASFTAGDEVIAGPSGTLITRSQVGSLLTTGHWIMPVGIALDSSASTGADVRILFSRGSAIQVP